ncbi:Asc-type amino acid transporter 1, partial [Clarias magur]
EEKERWTGPSGRGLSRQSASPYPVPSPSAEDEEADDVTAVLWEMQHGTWGWILQ